MISSKVRTVAALAAVVALSVAGGASGDAKSDGSQTRPSSPTSTAVQTSCLSGASSTSIRSVGEAVATVARKG
jgi:hypothetical protein